MRGSVCQLLVLAHAVCAITGPRIDEFDRRRQVALGHPGFSEHQTRFGLNSPLQNFQSQGLLNNPTQPPIFPQPIFQQNQPQSYVPQFNSQNLLPTQNTISNSLPISTNIQFPFNHNQPNLIQGNFAPTLQPQLQQTNVLSQPIPTLPAFQNGLPIHQNTPSFQNHNLHSTTVNIGNQRPTQPAFLPTIPPQTGFNQPSPISIHPAPNLSPQNFNDYQSNLGQNPVFGNNQNQNQQLQNLYEQQSKENLEKLKELQERQRIIQKHQEFVQKQQQKQQEKVEKLHEEFLSKQATKSIPTFPTTENYEDFLNRNPEHRRPILPYETDLFRKAVENYERDHPTTTTSTTTTTTTTTTPPPTTRFRPRPQTQTRRPPQEKNKQKLYNEIKNLLEESETKGFDDSLRAKSVALLQKPDILKQLRVALAENPEDFNEKNYSSREISLNGQKYEVIRTTNPNLIPKGAAAITADGSSISQMVTASPPQKENRISFEDLTKGVLPPGANFELIKHSENGKLEEVSKIPNTLQNKKKVTFVFLEEQDDGSYKVKGVKANGQQTEEGPEVENILGKIKRGEIQLPGPTKISNSIASSSSRPEPENDFVAASSHHPSSYSSFVSTSNHGTTGHTNPVIHTTPSTSTIYRSSSTPQTVRTTRPPTYSPSTRSPSTTELYVSKSTQQTYTPERIGLAAHNTRNLFSSPVISTTPAYRVSSYDDDLVVIGSSTANPNDDQSAFPSNHARQGNPSLVDILKENGLFATAKYLKQSGLDTILNETGPYTIFAPTDKAFRTLLVQLGGPDKAEEKFRDNPRLLSGLLLHHVIPGAFDIASLQDEMTGVSLAGTQLRVNQYDMHDVEWNEVKITTVNGARVVDDKKDIHIPHGIAHAVDRVMFPLPVGDLVQTLQADRDRRFTTFLKAIYASGFAETLAESKTYTIFAPTDSAFARMTPVELSRYSDKAAAKTLVARHVLPGTLYSAGMRYYQLRNSMEDSKPLTLQKNAGRIKVNNAQVITHNIPATNGVIHAIDNLL